MEDRALMYALGDIVGTVDKMRGTDRNALKCQSACSELTDLVPAASLCQRKCTAC